MYAATTEANVLFERIAAAPRIERSTMLFAGILLFVSAVSIYDGYLVVRTGDMILEFEQNPVGVYLINCLDGDPTLFLAVKAVGTVLVVTVLTLLHRRSQRLAFPVAFALMAFQGGLLVFLEVA